MLTKDDLDKISQAVSQECEVFVTMNPRILEHRDELSKIYQIRFLTPTEAVEELDMDNVDIVNTEDHD